MQTTELKIYLYIHIQHTFIQRTKYRQKQLFKIGNTIKFIAKIS